MPRRTILTERQRAALFDLPTDEAAITRHYTLSEEDVALIRRRHRARNRLGFALQLCAFRYPGRLLQRGELIPRMVLSFVAAQLGLDPDEVADYAVRGTTRYQHSAVLQEAYGFRPFAGAARRELEEWLAPRAEDARTNLELAAAMLEACRRRRLIVPAASTIERACARALVEAERRIARRIVERLPRSTRRRLEALLDERVDARVSRFVWLRQMPGGGAATTILRLLDRLDFVRGIRLDDDAFAGIPAHRVTRLRREGERLYADGLKELPSDRRLAILAACLVEWRATLVDAALESHDRIIGRFLRAAERRRDERLRGERRGVTETLRLFAEIGGALIEARRSGRDAFEALEDVLAWPAFEARVRDAARLTGAVDVDDLDVLLGAYPQVRRYAPRFLEAFRFQGAAAAQALLQGVELLRRLNARGERRVPDDAPTRFVRGRWAKRVFRDGRVDRRAYELCVLVELRDALRAGDLWVEESRRYRSIDHDLLPASAVRTTPTFGLPLDADGYLHERRDAMHRKLVAVSEALDGGALPDASVRDGRLHLSPLRRATPEGAAALALQLYAMAPRVGITDLLAEVDGWTAFTDAFTHLRTGAPPGDRKALLTVLLADGINLGLRRMAEACKEYSFWELLRVASWHVRDHTYNHALATLIDAQRTLPLASLWGAGTTSSSDGQHFPAGGQGEAVNVVNARHGPDPGVTFYTHISDQFGPFHTKVIAATAHEAPHVLDGLLQHESGLAIEEHYTDTGGFTDHVFACCALLGFRFAPRIRDLRDKRLYTFDAASVYPGLAALIAGRINERLIRSHWGDMMRVAASMATGRVVPSHILQKLQAYPRRNSLALALREVGRIERTLFTLDWLQDIGLRRRAQIGLNKGEARHALARALFFNRLGELRDRGREPQSHKASGLNLLTAAIVLWNTAYLEKAVAVLRGRGQSVPDELLAHVSPLAWEHIGLTGEYSWRSAIETSLDDLRPLRISSFADPKW